MMPPADSRAGTSQRDVPTKVRFMERGNSRRQVRLFGTFVGQTPRCVVLKDSGGFSLPMNPEEHPTSNIEWQRESSPTSEFGVRCWTFDVFPRFCTQHRMGFGQSSFEPMLAWKVLPNNPENAGRPYQSQRLSKGNYSVTLIRRNASKCLVSSSIRFKSRLLNETQSRNCRLSSRFLSEFR